MSSYYKMFAMGMGDNSNENFAAWVEPYEYLTGVKGTTIGSAVFDRSVVPHVFLGVVGVDFTIEEMQSIGGSSYEDVLSALVGRSNAVCPSIDKSTCILEALREESGWENSCPNQPQCAEKVNVVAQKCTGVGDYPNILWDNYNAQGEAFVDRVCCNFDASGGNRGENPGRLSQGQCGVLGELPMSVVIGGAALIVLVIVIGQWKKSAASKVHASPAAPAPAAPAPAAPAPAAQVQQMMQQVQVQQPQIMAPMAMTQPMAAPVYHQQQQTQMQMQVRRAKRGRAKRSEGVECAASRNSASEFPLAFLNTPSISPLLTLASLVQPMQQQMQQPMYGQQMQGQQMQGRQMQQPMVPQMAVAMPIK